LARIQRKEEPIDMAKCLSLGLSKESVLLLSAEQPGNSQATARQQPGNSQTTAGLTQ